MRLTRKWIVTAVALSLCHAVHAEDPVKIGDLEWHRSEWRASTFDLSTQSQAALDVDNEGNIVVIWSSRRQQEGSYGVYAQRFDERGVALGGETCVNLWSRSHQWTPAIAVACVEHVTESIDVLIVGGTRLVRCEARPWAVWRSHRQDGSAGAIVARRFDGSFAGSAEMLVNQEAQGEQAAPVVAALPDGGVVVAWTTAPDNGPMQVRMRRFAADGQPASHERGLPHSCGLTQSIPSIAVRDDGSFAIAYAVADPEMHVPLGVRLQRFDQEGTPVGGAVNVCDELEANQIEPIVAASADGYIVAWLDAASDGDDYGVLARRFDAGGEPIGEAWVVNATTEGPQTAAAVAAADDGRFAIAWNGTDDDGAGIFAQLFASDGSRIGGEFRLTRASSGAQAMEAARGTQRLAFAPNGALVCAWSGDGGFGDSSSVNVTVLSPQAITLGGEAQGVTSGMKPAVDTDRDAWMVADAAKPHQPPTFDPRRAEEGPREVWRGAADIGFTGIFNTGWTPPDPHLAVGPEHVVAMTNGQISIFTKDGTEIFFDEIEDDFGFWGDLGTTGFVFDPEVLYDELSGRFFAMASEAYAPGANSYVLIAVSTDSTPEDGDDWHKYRFATTDLAGNLFDSPNIGVDEEVVYVTGDGFGLGANYPVFTFDKPSLLNGDPPAVMQSTTLATSTQSAGIPPVSFDDPPALYMIEHEENFSNSSVRLIALQDPLGDMDFTTTTLSVPTYGPPEDPPQQGTSNRPETFDARFWSVAYRNGSLWATHHINSSRVRARWYEIAMNGWPDSGLQPQLLQSGTIDPGPGVRTFFCSITADDYGNAAVLYARSAPNEFISMESTYRYASDPLGTMQPGVNWKASTGPYFSGRWGDYSQINVDPSDGITMWAHHEWAEGNSWRTWIQGFTPEFSDADFNFNGIVDVDDLLSLLSDWGPCPACATDLDGDGEVAVNDLLQLLASWD